MPTGAVNRVFKSASHSIAKGYFGNTDWNTDFAAEITSSATDGRFPGAGSTASARKSSGGRGSGISAGGVGRDGSSVRAPGEASGFESGGVETRIGGGRGCSAGAIATGAAGDAGAVAARGGSWAWAVSWEREGSGAPRNRSIAARARSLASGAFSAGGAGAAATTGSAGGATVTGAVRVAAFSRGVG
jgi:hypothetical protein